MVVIIGLTFLEDINAALLKTGVLKKIYGLNNEKKPEGTYFIRWRLAICVKF
jgi:hypothetical protein